MRRKILIIAIFFLSFFFSDTVVYADKNAFIYDIESFTVTADRKLVFEGWAYVDGYHNTGGVDTEISIIAGGLVEKKATYNSSKNYALYYANCFKKGLTCTDTYETAKCGDSRESNCRFDNVGFRIEFDILELYEKFGPDKDIDFKIKISHDKAPDIAEEYIAITPYTAGDWSSNLSFTLPDETLVVIEVGDTSDVAYIRKNYGRVATNTDGTLRVSTQFYWDFKQYFKITDIRSSTNELYSGMKMYQLRYNCNSIGCKPGGHAIPGNNDLGWAYAAWVQVDGRLTIRFLAELFEEKESCDTAMKSIPEDPLICTSENYEQKNIEDVSVTRTISESDEDYSKRRVLVDGKTLEKVSYDGKVTCTKDLKQVISAKDVVIHQKGEPYFSLKPSSIYAGGGFSFSAKYEGEAEYKLCYDMEYVVSEEGIVYTCENNPPSSNKKKGYEYGSPSLSDDKKTCTYKGKKDGDTTSMSQEEYNNKKSSYPSRDYDCDCKNGSCSCTKILRDTISVSSKPQCKTFSAPAVACGKVRNGECKNEWDEFGKEMSNEYLESSFNHNAKTFSKDSNDATEEKFNEVDSWSDSYKKPEIWDPEVKVTSKLQFNLKNACINRRTAEVTYKSNCNSESEIDGGNLYYIPLKYPNGKFPVKVSITNLSIVKIMTWPLEYECGVNCQQKIYRDPPKDLSYKIIYRPITMSNPFPERKWGWNWDIFMNDEQAKTSKLNRDKDKIEYSAILNSASIKAIKAYNKEANNNEKKYFSMETISYSGKSNFLDDYGIKREINNYNKLGECTKDCWTNSNDKDGGY